MLLLALTVTLSLTGVAQVLIGLAATATAVGVLSRLRPVRWLWRTSVVEPSTEWLECVVGKVVDEKLDARPILNGKGEQMIKQVHQVAEKVGA